MMGGGFFTYLCSSILILTLEKKKPVSEPTKCMLYIQILPNAFFMLDFGDIFFIFFSFFAFFIQKTFQNCQHCCANNFLF